MSVSRVVTFLTPVFVALAAWACDAVARYVPGHPHLDSAELTVLMSVGATAAFGVVIKWLHGLQKHEARVAEHANAAAVAKAARQPARKPAGKA